MMTKEDLKRFLLDKIGEGYCLVIGTNEMMDNFTSAFRAPIDIMMMDYQTEEGKVVSKPIEIFNARIKEIQSLGMVKKIDIISARRMLNLTSSDKEDDMVAIELVQEIDDECGYSYNINGIAVKTDQEKIDLINSMFRSPESINDELRKI